VVGTRAVLMGVSAIFIAQLLFTYAPFMQAIFKTRPVALTDGLVIIVIGLTMLIIVEIEKAIRRRVAIGMRA
jgi:hypothetical protein